MVAGLWSLLLVSGLVCSVLVPGTYTLAFFLLHTLINCDCLVYSISQSGAPVKLHVRARFSRYERNFNSHLCLAAPYVQVRTKRLLRCPNQPDRRRDSNPNPNPYPNPNPTLWGARGLLFLVDRGSTELTCK